MPYVAVPLLTAVLRRLGHEVLQVDANLEAVESLLRPEAITKLVARVSSRLVVLHGKPRLAHQEQLEIAELSEALWAARGLEARILGAQAVFKDKDGAKFLDAAIYDEAVASVQAALEIIGAAYSPLELDFARFRTPFSWLTPQEVARDAQAERDPFRPWVAESLAPRLRLAGVSFVGLSVAFPGQLQPAWSMATALREELPDAYIVVGGPAVTQRLAPLAPAMQQTVLGPFDAAVLFEGEQALCELVEAHRQGRPRRGVIRGAPLASLAELPAPDFDGLPLDRYLSPELVLPYDASRGCPWNRCAFCHYGLAEHGTARYRARSPEVVASHLQTLGARYGSRLFYLSQDTLTLRQGLALAQGLKASGGGLRWASDMRPEGGLTSEGARELASGGCLALSLGVESGADRLLGLIDKGVTTAVVSRAIRTLAGAGIAVEAMAFTDFPTETGPEALETISFLESHRSEMALFVCGSFDLTSGSRVARDPARYGIQEIFLVSGDELGTGLFYREKRSSKSPKEREAVEQALDALSERFRLRPYPWAGSLSTAHSLLYYLRLGPGAFRGRRSSASRGHGSTSSPLSHVREGGGSHSQLESSALRSRYAVEELARRARANEEKIWETLVFQRREVSREAYEAQARVLPEARPRSGAGILGESPSRTKSSGSRGSGRRGKRTRR
jgi:hypothetical protein